MCVCLLRASPFSFSIPPTNPLQHSQALADAARLCDEWNVERLCGKYALDAIVHLVRSHEGEVSPLPDVVSLPTARERVEGEAALPVRTSDAAVEVHAEGAVHSTSGELFSGSKIMPPHERAAAEQLFPYVRRVLQNPALLLAVFSTRPEMLKVLQHELKVGLGRMRPTSAPLRSFLAPSPGTCSSILALPRTAEGHECDSQWWRPWGRGRCRRRACRRGLVTR